MARPIIEVQNLGKWYTLGSIGGRTLREATERIWLRLLGRDSPVPSQKLRHMLPDQHGPRPNSFWALKDITFSVNEGEILGIIGRNGAGKSTLLKILSRITEPSAGQGILRGRVASILEVGTGFHPELTGRDNIFLNGAMLGMKRSETRRKFDEIVEFAEVGEFLDTPVKRYSSGMYVRLAFAVAAHLEPEILIVDEVLAVGDAAFQKKCLGKMSEVAHEGRTVLFVSHNMDAVRRLCTRCILLDNGRVETEGTEIEVTSRYLVRSLERGAPNQWIDLSKARRHGTGEAHIEAVRYRSSAGSGSIPTTDGPLEVTIRISADLDLGVRCLALMINDSQGNRLLNADIATHGQQVELQKGINLVSISIEQLHLNPGSYILGLWLARGIEDEVPLDSFESATIIEVVELAPSGFAYPFAMGPIACEFGVRLLSPSDASLSRDHHLTGV